MKSNHIPSRQSYITIALALSLVSGNLWAQEANEEKMDHAAHQQMQEQEDNSSSNDHAGMESMDHGEMTIQDNNSSSAEDASMGAMDHGDMQMQGGTAQGGTAPVDARDPHAYSNGFTLTEGPYALSGARLLKLADEHSFWVVSADRFEFLPETNTTVFDLQGWYGRTYDRLAIKLEGDFVNERLEESQTDLLWSHAISGYFDSQLGLRFDQFDDGENREWLAFGFQGLAPYWFELDVTAYIGESGRTALSAEAEYELLLTQRLILQPRAEINLYGKDDTDNEIGSGISDAAIGIRLRYEITRQFAPYIGIEWTRKFGETADFAQAANEQVEDTQFIAGLKFWF